VLYPSPKAAPKIEGASELALTRVLQVETCRHRTVEYVDAAVLASHWMRELSFEILRVSKFREMKRERRIRALAASAISCACLFGRRHVKVI
jgi:hypothetical protein